MNKLLIFSALFILLALLLSFRAYAEGSPKVLKRIAAMVLALCLARVSVRIGSSFAPASLNIIFILAGFITLFFCTIFKTIFNSGQPSRYGQLTLLSRRWALFLSLGELLLLSSFILFYVKTFFPSHLPAESFFQPIQQVLEFPIRLFWFFPR